MYDVLIVGGGAAGIRAAVAAAGTDPRLRIAMVSKVYPMRSHTVSAEGGAAAVLREDDSLDGHAFDTIKGSDYLADQDVVEYFVQQAPHEINQLERWGCPWSREPDGSISVRPFGGMTTWRTCFAADKTGFHMLHALFQTSLQYTQVVRHDESFVTSLLVEDGRCLGVTAMDARTGTVEALRARAVILATGGAGRIYSFTTNAAICTGDGMALAYRAGAPLKDMEFVQFHPTGLPHTGILITEAVRGEGGYLLNKEGERFLERYVPTRMELGPRDIISRAIITEFEAGRGYEGPYGNYVHLDVRHLGERTIDEKLPFARE
ncbi:MAG TPA: FAD-binding protein, partial [Chloroflexota bacterium]|nr:FAD-binding protein [Chloroflexota bacterium]